MKKFLSVVLALCMILSSIVVVAAAGTDSWTREFEDLEFAINEGEPITPGKITMLPEFAEGESVNLNDYKYVDLVLYAYNPSAMGDELMQYEMTSSGQADVEENCYAVYFRDLGIQEGWNVVRITMDKFTTGPANIEKINFMRFFSASTLQAVPANTFLKIQSVTLTNNDTKPAAPTTEVELPAFEKEEEKPSTVVDTTYEIVIDKSFDFAAGTIVAGSPLNFSAGFDPLDISAVKYVDMYVDVSNAAQFANVEFQFELTSGGGCDAFENNFTGHFTGLVDGANVIRIPIEDISTPVGGGWDMTKINYTRMYSQAGSVDAAFTVKVDKIVLVAAEGGAEAPADSVETQTFVVGSEEEKSFIHEDNSHKNPDCYYTDAGAYITYKFTAANTRNVKKVELTGSFGAQLWLQVSPDGTTWTDVFFYEFDPAGEPQQGLDRKQRTYDLTALVDLTKSADIYVKIDDAYPSNGWGGAIAMNSNITLDITYVPGAPDLVSGPTGATTGVTHIFVIDNCNEDSVFENGGVETEVVKNGASARSFKFKGDVGHAGLMAHFKQQITPGWDVTGANRVAFDFWVEDASIFAEVPFCIEFCSGGVWDKEEFQLIGTLDEYVEGGLKNGWNTFSYSIDTSNTSQCNWTRYNFFRLFNNAAFNSPIDTKLVIDNFRFETYVAPPVEEEPTEGIETHTFRVFEDSELPYLLRTTAGNNGNQRFSDASSETVYKFVVTNRYSVKKVVWNAKLGAQLLLQISQDDENWTTVYAYEWDDSKGQDQGLPAKMMEFDLTEYLDLAANNTFYIRIADTTTENGWGGSIYCNADNTLTIEYEPMAAEDLDAMETAPGEGSISLQGFNKPMGGMKVDTADRTAGSASNTFTTKDGNVFSFTFDPIDGTGMDTLTFDLYVSDISLFDRFAGPGQNSGLELTSSGTWDQEEISWSLSTIKANNIGGDIVVGWNHIVLPLETGHPDGQEPAFDISAIDHIRFFMVGGADEDLGIVVKIDNMRLDNSGIQRAEEQKKADQEAAQKVIDLINAIGADITLDSESAIQRAANAYKRLSSAQKELVTNVATLEAAEEKLEELKAEETPGTETPGTETPGTETPGTETPGTETPGTETPGDDTPDNDKNNTTVIIIIVVAAVVVVAAAVCVYFFVIKKKK